MAFEKGHNLSTGRPKGSKNRISRDIRQVFHDVYDKMGDHVIDTQTGKKLTGHDAMLLWARDNPTEFYRLYGKMIPTTAEQQTDGHEDFIDELIFIDEQPKLIEAVDVTNEPEVGSKEQASLESGEYIPQIETDIPPPKQETSNAV